jgi:hypothetical protein
MFAGQPGEEREAVHRAASLRLLSDPDDLRLAAAAALLREGASWPRNLDAQWRQRIARACRIALDLDSTPAAAMLAYLLTRTYEGADASPERMKVLEATIEVLESIESDNTVWSQLLDKLLAQWLRLRRGERMPEVRVQGPGDAAAKAETAKIGEAIVDIQLAVEARAMRSGDAPAPRGVERSEEDILWNAVLASRTQHFESMPEIFDFSTQAMQKLVRLGSIPAEAATYAATGLAGLLKWLWGSQNAVSLPREMIVGQAGTLAQLLRSIQTNWPPRPSEWFAAVRDVPEQMRATLATLDDLPDDEHLYAPLNAALDKIEQNTKALLTSASGRFPERAPDIAAWILGSLIENNTYSYTQGSVAEDIDEGLSAIHGRLAAGAEGYFMPWLMEGFRPVREQTYDEVSRWRYGLDAPLPAAQ